MTRALPEPWASQIALAAAVREVWERMAPATQAAPADKSVVTFCVPCGILTSSGTSRGEQSSCTAND